MLSIFFLTKCLFFEKFFKKTNQKIKKNLIADQIRNLEQNNEEMSRSLSSDYVEMQTNGCQTEFNDLKLQKNYANSIQIDNTDTSNKVPSVEASENFYVIPELIMDAKPNFSSFDQSFHRNSNNEHATFYNNIPSATMRFNMATRNETQSIKQAIINENEDVNDQNINENPNFNICQGKGNIIANRKNHCVLNNCPKKMNKIDQSKILDETSSNSSDSSDSEDNSVISIHTDDSEIKDMFKNADIPRTSSTTNIKQYVIY